MEKATKSQAVNGVDHTTIMTPLRVKEAILALSSEESQKDYSLLENKPQINGVTLEGNKTSEQLGIVGAVKDVQKEGQSVVVDGVANIVETDPTVPDYVKSITQDNITSWTNKWDKTEGQQYVSNAVTPLAEQLNRASSDIEQLYTDTANLETTKQDLLVSGQNIKTINNISILGEGNIEIKGEGGSILIWDSALAPNDPTLFNLACEKMDTNEPFVFLGNINIVTGREIGDEGQEILTLTKYLVPFNIGKMNTDEDWQYYSFTTSPIYVYGHYEVGGVRLEGTWGQYTRVEEILWDEKMTPATKRDLENIETNNDHATLSNLDYTNSGHTGFASSSQLNLLETKVNNNYTTLNNAITNVSNDLGDYKDTTDETLQELKDRIRVDDKGNIIIDGKTIDTSKIIVDTIDLGNFGFIVNSDESLSFRKVKGF